MHIMKKKINVILAAKCLGKGYVHKRMEPSNVFLVEQTSL